MTDGELSALLQAASDVAAELTEAAAALPDLAIGLADESSAVARLNELAELQAGLDPGIRVMTNGHVL